MRLSRSAGCWLSGRLGMIENSNSVFAMAGLGSRWSAFELAWRRAAPATLSFWVTNLHRGNSNSKRCPKHLRKDVLLYDGRDPHTHGSIAHIAEACFGRSSDIRR